MWVPKSVPGGAELDPVSSLQVIENLAYGDPSAGWVLMAAALAVGTGAAFLSDAAVSELFGKPRLPVIAGQGTRPGLAVPKDDGFMLSGSWSFASGIKHGTHIHTLGVIEGTGEARIFVLPVEKATLIENWDVLGLRATGLVLAAGCAKASAGACSTSSRRMSGARWAEPGRWPPAKPSISSTPRPKVPIAPLVRWSTKRGAMYGTHSNVGSVCPRGSTR